MGVVNLFHITFIRFLKLFFLHYFLQNLYILWIINYNLSSKNICYYDNLYVGEKMKDKIITLLSNIDLEETEPVNDGIKRFIIEHDFNIIINGVTIFFDGSNDAEKMTYIEIYEDSIAFRTMVSYHQTTFVIFSYEDVNELEFKIDGNYHYF